MTAPAADNCPSCGCLWDDHRSLAAWLESDDPIEVAQRYSPDFNGPINLCGDCGDCTEEPPAPALLDEGSAA